LKFSKRLHTIAIAGALLALTAASSRADVIYNFSGAGSFPFTRPEPVAFQLTTPDFINIDPSGGLAPFSCGQMDSTTNCNSRVADAIFFAAGNIHVFGNIIPYHAIDFVAANSAVYSFYFQADAFDTPGVYTSLGPSNHATLSVTETPEPNMAPIAVGAICLVGIYRLVSRRSAAARSVRTS
jgi:hypothetical protein